MHWYDYRSMIKALCNGMHHKVTREDIIAIARREKHNLASDAIMILLEALWQQDKQPYYQLYPSVAEAFLKVDLDRIQCSDIHLPLPTLLVRTTGLDITAEETLRSMLIAEIPAAKDSRRKIGIIADVGESATSPQGITTPTHGIGLFSMHDDCTMEGLLARARDGLSTDNGLADAGPPLTEEVQEAIRNCMRLVCTLCLLKDNPDLIEPLPLEADKAKWEATHDPKYLEKARRRGKHGWAIGRHVEVAPGFRRPHFAIRWMGKGRVDPQLRPIKGCLVHRRKVVTVPTGYLGSEEEFQDQFIENDFQ